MSSNLILRVVVKMFIPFLLLFGLYVQLHGDFGPGGGFQAGVVIAAAYILFSLIFGVEHAKELVRPSWLEIAVPSGVIIFAGVGVVTLLMGGNFLDYDVLNSHDPSHGQHLGILVVEFGVLVTVSSTMLLIFYTFAGRGR
ncbi:MAG: cation:proton antiporter [Rhodospirillaceae bacterium]|nr:cation:proton antiporter [Rhodospirillaceae bacterium]